MTEGDPEFLQWGTCHGWEWRRDNGSGKECWHYVGKPYTHVYSGKNGTARALAAMWAQWKDSQPKHEPWCNTTHEKGEPCKHWQSAHASHPVDKEHEWCCGYHPNGECVPYSGVPDFNILRAAVLGGAKE